MGVCGQNKPRWSVAWLKAHLVAKGYAQTYGVDYSKTFSSVAKLTLVHILYLFSCY